MYVNYIVFPLCAMFSDFSGNLSLRSPLQTTASYIFITVSTCSIVGNFCSDPACVVAGKLVLVSRSQLFSRFFPPSLPGHLPPSLPPYPRSLSSATVIGLARTPDQTSAPAFSPVWPQYDMGIRYVSSPLPLPACYPSLPSFLAHHWPLEAISSPSTPLLGAHASISTMRSLPATRARASVPIYWQH
jgi:hypothetical protein